jgi:hypothetical protein
LGVDPQGNLLVGANNMPQTPSAQEAGQMAGLGENSGDRVKKVAKALGIDAKIIRKFQASQNEAFAMGRSKTASESGTGARVEPKESGVLTDESWYEPIAKKGLKGANHTELARAVLLSQRYLGTTKENESVATGLMNEAQARAKRPEFAAAFRKQQEILSPDRTGTSRKGENETALLAEPEYEEDVAPGQEEVVEEGEKAEKEVDDRYARGVEVESPDLNTEQVQALEDNDLAQAVALVSVDLTADRVHRAVAKRLAELLDATRVDLVDNLTDDKGRPILGRALISGEAIQLDRDRGMTQEVLLHEGVHAAAERVLVADEKLLTPQQLVAKQELQRLFEAVQKDPDITSVDAKASLSEFVAEVMSNRQLQEQLGKKPWRMSDAMQQFKSMILRLLGVKDAKSMLTSAMASVDAIFTPTSTQIGAKPTGSRPSLRPGTTAFDRWFGDSKVVNDKGKPKVMYHGTARDVTGFRAKQAGAIFVTEDPRFAAGFSEMSQSWMLNNYRSILTDKQIEAARNAVPRILEQEGYKGAEAASLQRQIDNNAPTGAAQAIWEAALKEQMPTGPNVMPLYVKAENPFDYQNKNHLARLRAWDYQNRYISIPGSRNQVINTVNVENGGWSSIEDPRTQKAIRDLGFDGFYVKEGGLKNLAVYSPTQIKSATGNVGAYGIAPETEKAVKGVNVIGEQAPALTPKGNPALRMRIKFADSLAGLEDVFTAAYSGQVRTATGRLNPIVLLSRALDTQRVSRAVQKEGALVTKEGLLMADKLVVDGREISYKDTLARIAETAKKEDKTYEQYRETIDKVLYGHLEYNLREYNRNLDQQADALEAAGKTKDAKAMRADKITLALNDKQIDALENAFQKDTFIKGISKDLDAIRFSLLDKLVEVGRISAEKAKEWKENTGYIPLQRIAEYAKEYDEAGRGTNRGVVAMKNIRKREGSERATTSPVENFSQFMDWAVGEAMKNEAGTRALTDLELLGSAKRQAEPPAFDSPGGMVTVYEKGVPVKFYVQDPGLYVGLSLQEKQLGSIAKAFQRLGTQPLRAGVTALPPFAIKQVFDDIVRAYAYAGVKNNAAVVKNILLNFPKNWYKEIFKVRDKGIQELENLGVVGTFDFTKQGNLKNILEEAGAKKEGLGSAIFRVMEAGAKASDLAVRQAIYNQVLKETGDIAQAESAAREIINFSRRGASGAMQTAISVIPFFNAYAQGMDKLATAAAGRVVGTKLGVARSMFYKRMAVLTGMGLAYALLMSDDENYQALPDHVRDTNWILPYGKYLGYTPAIPIPAELAFFFKAIPERIVQFYKHQGTDEEQAALGVVKELLVRGVDVFSSPNLTPQLIRPFLENITNHSWFLNRPLESQAQLRQRPFMRAGIGTSDSMKAVAELLEDAANATGIEAITISPIKLENLIRGLLGTAGGTVLALSDAAFFPSRTDRPLHQQLKSQLTGASAVMKDAVGTRYLDKVYKLESDVEQVYNTYNRLLQDKPEKTAEFIEDNKGLYSIRPAVQGLMTAIRSLNAAARQIDKTTDIGTDERRRRIDELRIEQNDLARQALMLRKLAMNIQLGK